MQIPYLSHLEMKGPFLPLSTVCQKDTCSQRSYQKRQTQAVQALGNNPTTKGALGTLRRVLGSPTRLSSLQTQMQHREVRL